MPSVWTVFLGSAPQSTYLHKRHAEYAVSRLCRRLSGQHSLYPKIQEKKIAASQVARFRRDPVTGELVNFRRIVDVPVRESRSYGVEPPKDLLKKPRYAYVSFADQRQ